MKTRFRAYNPFEEIWLDMPEPKSGLKIDIQDCHELLKSTLLEHMKKANSTIGNYWAPGVIGIYGWFWEGEWSHTGEGWCQVY